VVSTLPFRPHNSHGRGPRLYGSSSDQPLWHSVGKSSAELTPRVSQEVLAELDNLQGFSPGNRNSRGKYKDASSKIIQVSPSQRKGSNSASGYVGRSTGGHGDESGQQYSGKSNRGNSSSNNERKPSEDANNGGQNPRKNRGGKDKSPNDPSDDGYPCLENMVHSSRTSHYCLIHRSPNASRAAYVRSRPVVKSLLTFQKPSRIGAWIREYTSLPCGTCRPRPKHAQRTSRALQGLLRCLRDL
jgi:hypothetical protein